MIFVVSTWLLLTTCAWYARADVDWRSVAASLHIPDSLAAQIHELGHISEVVPPAVTRVLFTKQDQEAREFVRKKMKSAGMEVMDDEMGNIYGTWAGTAPEQRSVATGSHTDAIPLSGMYDGVLGVLGGIAAVAALRDAGFKPKRSIEVIMFTSEEPTRFGISCIGSRVMANALPASKLTSAVDSGGLTFVEAGRQAGYQMARGAEGVLQAVQERARQIGHFVELHIEQGPELEQEGLEIGIVTAIAAPATLRVRFQGDGGHAGGQMMPLRNDASLAMAEFCLAVEEIVLKEGGADSVSTCGHWRIEPNAVNSVPRVAEVLLDVRDIVLERRDALLASMEKHAASISKKRKVRVEVHTINKDPPAQCSPAVQQAAEAGVHGVGGLRFKRMVSHAYHDSLFVAQVAPTGMLFIPCYKGYSHRPDEFATDAHMEAGVRVLAMTLARLSAGTFQGEDLRHTEL